MGWVRLQNENSELKGQKRKLKDDPKEERCKKGKIEEKLKEAETHNKEITGKLRKKFKRLVQKLMKMQKEQKSRGPA